MKHQRPGDGTPGRGGDHGFSSNSATVSLHRSAPEPQALTNRNLLLGQLRAVWWFQWRAGVRLPAEPGVILIEGGRS